MAAGADRSRPVVRNHVALPRDRALEPYSTRAAELNGRWTHRRIIVQTFVFDVEA